MKSIFTLVIAVISVCILKADWLNSEFMSYGYLPGPVNDTMVFNNLAHNIDGKIIFEGDVDDDYNFIINELKVVQNIKVFLKDEDSTKNRTYFLDSRTLELYAVYDSAKNILRLNATDTNSHVKTIIVEDGKSGIAVEYNDRDTAEHYTENKYTDWLFKLNGSKIITENREQFRIITLSFEKSNPSMPLLFPFEQVNLNTGISKEMVLGMKIHAPFRFEYGHESGWWWSYDTITIGQNLKMDLQVNIKNSKFLGFMEVSEHTSNSTIYPRTIRYNIRHPKYGGKDAWFLYEKNNPKNRMFYAKGSNRAKLNTYYQVRYYSNSGYDDRYGMSITFNVPVHIDDNMYEIEFFGYKKNPRDFHTPLIWTLGIRPRNIWHKKVKEYFLIYFHKDEKGYFLGDTFSVNKGVWGNYEDIGTFDEYYSKELELNFKIITRDSLCIFSGPDVCVLRFKTNPYYKKSKPWHPPIDSIPPFITETLPKNKAINVSRLPSVRIEFSEKVFIDTSDVSFALYDNGAVSKILPFTSYDFADSIITFKPVDSLDWYSNYIVIVKKGIKDKSGNRMENDFSFRFTTVKETSIPILLSTYPADGATNIPVDTALVLVFSEPVEPRTINRTNFYMPHAGKFVDGKFIINGNIVTYKPQKPLEAKAQYTYYVLGGISDLYNNKMDKDYTINFYTADPTSVAEQSREATITPNPATDYIDVMLNEVKHPFLSVKIYDVLGVCMLTHPLTPSEGGHIRLDVSGLAAGVYFVRVGGKMYKFVKM